jgi:hypothetical protein
MSKHMRTFAVLSIAVALAACSRGSSAPDASKLPLLTGAYTFAGRQGILDAQNQAVWLGYPHGTLTFGDTIPGTLHGDASSGQVDVALSGTLTATDLIFVGNNGSSSSAPLFVAPARSATLKLDNGVVQSVTFNVTVLNQTVYPDRGRPPFMEFALMHAGGDNFEGSAGIAASSLRKP